MGVRKITTWTSKRKLAVSMYNVGFTGASQEPSSRPSLRLVCQPFRPLVGDPLTKNWTRNGEPYALRLPAFAIPSSQLAKTSRNMDSLVDSNYVKLIEELGDSQDEIISRIMPEAARQSNHVRRKFVL